MNGCRYLIEGVEMFRQGSYPRANGKTITYSADDIKAIAQSYNPTLLEAQVSVDHEGKGPSYGQVARLYEQNGSLFGDIVLNDEYFAHEITSKRKRYPTRSAEILPPGVLPNIDSPYLSGISFLGVKMPAVVGMRPIDNSAIRPIEYSKDAEVERYCFACDDDKNNQESAMTDDKQVQDEYKSKYESLMKEFEAKSKDLDELKKKMKGKETFEAADKAYTNLFQAEGGPKITPAEKDSFVQIFSSLYEANEKTAEAYVNQFSSRSAVVETKDKLEPSVNGDSKDSLNFSNEQEKQDYNDAKKAREYAEANKVDFASALIAVQLAQKGNK
jgi:hypothetical protein